MAGERRRRLAAILAADVAAYSRLVGADEEGTLARLRALFREAVQPTVSAHQGRVFKLMGDAFLAEFPSAVEAVRCAVALQEQVEVRGAGEPEGRHVRLRVGVHLGDVVVEGGDLLGDGVNVAARLEALAEPGGIVVSAKVADEVRGRVPFALEDLGERALKNVERPVRAFRVASAAEVSPSAGAAERPALPLPGRPSLVVLPFQNMSGDPEQEYFADGMVEEITTTLSRVRWLFVIARNSAYTYKGRAVDVRQVGRELGVRYVLEGSVRRAGARVRIAAQLVEAETGHHVWADRLDGDLADVFALQDRVTEAVARAVGPRLRGAETERSRRKPPASLDAYDLYLQALPHYYAMTRDGSTEALRLARASLSLEPRYAAAAGLASAALGYRHGQGWCEDPEAELGEALRLARDAVAHDPADPDALAMAARIVGYAADALDEAMDLAGRAVALNPNSAFVLSQCGWAYQYAGRSSEAIGMLERALRIDPLDPMAHSASAALAIARIIGGDLEAAAAAARRALAQCPGFGIGLRALAAALALSGRREEAAQVARTLLALQPDFSIGRFFGRRPRTLAAQGLYIEGLRRAGLPE